LLDELRRSPRLDREVLPDFVDPPLERRPLDLDLAFSLAISGSSR
jgi:hypothetical protein